MRILHHQIEVVRLVHIIEERKDRAVSEHPQSGEDTQPPDQRPLRSRPDRGLGPVGRTFAGAADARYGPSVRVGLLFVSHDWLAKKNVPLGKRDLPDGSAPWG